MGLRVRVHIDHRAGTNGGGPLIIGCVSGHMTSDQHSALLNSTILATSLCYYEHTQLIVILLYCFCPWLQYAAKKLSYLLC